MENRERLGSRLGFIMLSAGCAIGCGNVWKLPWMCGQFGGGSFMLVYLLCLALLGLTTALGFSVISFQPFAEGSTWLDLWDFIVSSNVLPLGTLVLALFCCHRRGWGWDNFLAEANAGRGMKIRSWMKPLFQWFVPAVILFIYICGMVTFQWR